jgi:RimJ/RimL family protein N-acetyltransferase
MIQTPRLDLVPGTVECLAADLAGRSALAQWFAIDIPANWPPELYDAEAIRYALEAHRDGTMDATWTFHYVFLRTPKRLIGISGFKGRPDAAGRVEIGYSVLPQFRGHGFATEAAGALSEYALSVAGVTSVVAQTLTGLAESIRVAERAGFVLIGRGSDPHARSNDDVLLFEKRATSVPGPR